MLCSGKLVLLGRSRTAWGWFSSRVWHFVTPWTAVCRPLLLLPSIFSSIRVFSSELALHIRWPKYCSPSNQYSELISFTFDWFDLLAVQETLKGLLQHHNSKASIFWRLAFFMVQLSHPYMTTGKTISLTGWIVWMDNQGSAGIWRGKQKQWEKERDKAHREKEITKKIRNLSKMVTNIFQKEKIHEITRSY